MVQYNIKEISQSKRLVNSMSQVDTFASIKLITTMVDDYAYYALQTFI